MAEQISNESVNTAMTPRFMSYAQSVLMDRAIPSGFDGLKPIHRRILTAMNDLGLNSNTSYKKSAKTIGLVLSEYSPHGDMSAYDALVRLAQNFSMRYPLVDGSGNFGSVNSPDSYAAMRYTESRLSPFGELLIGDISLAEMKPNFDGSAEEPINLVGYFPQILCGSIDGIAVGFATKFAPHYARDVYNAIIKIINNTIENKDTNIDDLIDIIKAPDFPTGAQIINTSEVRNIYKTGKGSITLRAKYITEKDKIIYTEIPYKVSPSSIITSIVGLNIADIKDVRDESSIRTGIRIVVELKKGANSEWIINRLFKETALQSNFNINMVAIMNDHLATNLDLKTILLYYLSNISNVHAKSINKQQEIIKTKLFKINAMLKAINHIEEIASLIKNSENPQKSLCESFQFTEEEAVYILNCKISFISKASSEALNKSLVELTAELNRLNTIMENQVNFLTDLKNKFISIRDSKIFKDDKRRTELLDIGSNTKNLDIRTYTKKEPVVITYTNKGMIKATRPDEFKINRRNTMGVKNKTLREGECICNLLSLDTHAELLLFSDLGKCYTLPVYKIPITNRNGASKSINNYVTLSDEEKILSIIGYNNEDKKEDSDQSLVMVTKSGLIKRLRLSDLTKSRFSTSGTRAITLQDDDKIKAANVCAQNSDIVIFTNLGRGLKLNIDDEAKPLKMMRKNAKGLLALKLKNDECVVNASVINENRSIILITSKGFGKRLDYSTFKNQRRNQTPINYMAKLDTVGKIVDGIMVNKDEDLLITTRENQTVRLNLDDLTSKGRNSLGLKMINIKSKTDYVIGISVLKREEDNENDEYTEN